MGAAGERFHTSAVAGGALGDEVVEHYTNMADVELAAYNSTVTDCVNRVTGYTRLGGSKVNCLRVNVSGPRLRDS